MKIIHKGFVYENINTFNDFTVYSLREEFKNKQFNDIEQAQTYFKKYCEVHNIDYEKALEKASFDNLGEGIGIKIRFKIENTKQSATKKPKHKLEYLTNKDLARDALGLYRSYYPVEFDSNEKSKFITLPIDELEFTEHPNQKHVEKLMLAIEEGEELPPPIVDEFNSILDGHHRVMAAMRLGIKEIPVIMLYEPE